MNFNSKHNKRILNMSNKQSHHHSNNNTSFSKNEIIIYLPKNFIRRNVLLSSHFNHRNNINNTTTTTITDNNNNKVVTKNISFYINNNQQNRSVVLKRNYSMIYTKKKIKCNNNNNNNIYKKCSNDKSESFSKEKILNGLKQKIDRIKDYYRSNSFNERSNISTLFSSMNNSVVVNDNDDDNDYNTYIYNQVLNKVNTNRNCFSSINKQRTTHHKKTNSVNIHNKSISYYTELFQNDINNDCNCNCNDNHRKDNNSIKTERSINKHNDTYLNVLINKPSPNTNNIKVFTNNSSMKTSSVFNCRYKNINNIYKHIYN